MMKRAAILFLAALLLTGCQETGSAPTPTSTQATVVTQPSTIPTSPSTVPTEPTEAPTGPQPTEPAGPPDILPQYQSLYDQNNDLVGWISIPGTVIDLPVVQSPYQKNYYLRRDFQKQNATAGTIYVREECDVFSPSDNLTIYGHKMRNGTMFADLHKYKQASFWENNRYIRFDTIYEEHTYEIFAVFTSCADLTDPANFRYHLFDDAEDQEAFDRFVARCKDMSYYDTGITPQFGDKLITLSTCDKTVYDGRLVVVARRIN